MADEEGCVNYIRELVFLFRKVGGQAERESVSLGGAERAFHEGRGAAIREVLSFMKSQAEIFDVSPQAIGLEGFEPMVDELRLPAHLDTKNEDK